MKRKRLAGVLALMLLVSLSATGLSAAAEDSAAPAQTQTSSDAAQALYQGLWDCRDTIDLSKYAIPVAEFSTLFEQTVVFSPELFHVEGGYRYSFSTSDNRLLVVYPNYRYTGAELAEKRTVYRQKLNAILAGVDPAWSDGEIALYLHDYLAAHFTYDTTYTHYDAYSFLTTGTGVCQAYASTYIALLQAFDIPVDYVVSDAMNHAWNAIELDGDWYHVDVTWDDPVGQPTGAAAHRNFLLSDAAIREREHDDWQFTAREDTRCTSTRYDQTVWTDVETPFVPLNGRWYYIGEQSGGDYAIYSTDWQTTQALLPLTERWSAGGHSVWLGYYAGLGSYGGRLIWNTPTAICALTPDTMKRETLYESQAQPAIYGLTVDGPWATYVRKTSPNEPGEERYTIRLPLPPSRGDMDDNGRVTAVDALLVLKAVTGYHTLTEEQTAAVDVDGQSGVTILDALCILQYAAGRITRFPADVA